MTDRNNIQIAASTENLAHARYLIMTCLRIEDRTVADRILPSASMWGAMNYFKRAMVIRSWLAAECFACVEEKEETEEMDADLLRYLKETAS